MSGRLTDHAVLIFDVYGTLADWESGIYTALQPLLARFPKSASWSRNDVLLAFLSVETDIQAQNPTMLYSDLLAMVHVALEARLVAASGQFTGITATTVDGSPDTPTNASFEMSTSTSSPLPPNRHTAFGNSVIHWPIFPDTCRALHALAKHFKLVVLSNVDHASFAHTHALLSEGASPSPNLSPELYAFPSPNPHKYWFPQRTPGSKSPFTLILTAQDTHVYKPALRGFEIAMECIREEGLLGGVAGESVDHPPRASATSDPEASKSRVLVVAQSLTHDHVPARSLGIKSVWIDRQTAVMCRDLGREQAGWAWRFETLGEMAEAVEREAEFGRG